MALVSINWKPTPRELRWFGVAMIVGFGVMGTLCQFGGWPVGEPHPKTAVVLWVVGGIAGALGLTGTRAALPVYWAWMAVALVMGTIVSYVLLALVFYVLFTFMGLLARLVGRDRLQLRRPPSSTPSYWQDIPRTSARPNYERQF